MRAKWPKLRPTNHKLTSQATARYNCVGFGIKDERRWWEAGLHGGRYYWPPDIPDTLDGWVLLFAREGYELTTNRNVEAGREKIAIYVSLDDMQPGHVAISDGRAWKSKLGEFQDIEHESLELLEGDHSCEYGIVEKILHRPLPIKRKGRARKK